MLGGEGGVLLLLVEGGLQLGAGGQRLHLFKHPFQRVSLALGEHPAVDAAKLAAAHRHEDRDGAVGAQDLFGGDAPAERVGPVLVVVAAGQGLDVIRRGQPAAQDRRAVGLLEMEGGFKAGSWAHGWEERMVDG